MRNTRMQLQNAECLGVVSPVTPRERVTHH